VITGWLAAAVAVVSAVLADDPPGRLLGVIAAAFLGAAALFGTVARPRLAVDDVEVAVRGLLGIRRWPWSRVHRLRVVRHRRLGREVAMLELDVMDADGSERLVVLGRLDLGAHPDDVLAEVQAVRGL
jgi:Bacterial PH domain